jgi:L-malate glycosyltransferase
MRVKVVHVVVAGQIGGAERMLIELASRPASSGAEHVVALMTPDPRLARLFESSGIVVRDRGRVRENAAAFLWRSMGPTDVTWLSGVLRGEQADVVHLHTVGSQVVGTRAALRCGARIVRTEHSTRAYTDPSCWPFSRWSLGRAHRVVAISRHIESVALSRDPTVRNRLSVVPNGVDTERFAPREARQEGRFVFAWVGRLEHRKGPDLALDALVSVLGAELEITGEGPEREALARRAASLGLAPRVRFHGYVEDTRDRLASADAALCSSREEGLGVALLEAMAMGLPVVALPVGGVPEIVRDGETGWLAAERTSEALAARMRDAMRSESKGKALGRAARETVVREYSACAMAEGYRRVYAGLVQEERHDLCPATP